MAARDRGALERVVVHVDGGARGNPGPAGIAAVGALDEHGAVLLEEGRYIGAATNNVAEYRAVLLGLELAACARGRATVEVVNDSELVARQLPGPLQGQAPGPAPPVRGDTGGAARVRHVVDPQRAPRAQRASRRPRERGPRREWRLTQGGAPR